MLNRDQKQEAKDGSTAIQAGGNVTITQSGLSAAEVRQLALDVFRANFYELAGEAKEIARARAEEIIENFINKLQKEYPAGLEKSKDPGFQAALFTVQKEYAKTGDKDLGDLLVDLLVDSTKHETRDIKQIVLTESLNTAPKLTENHLAALAVIFLFRYTHVYNVGNHQELAEFFDRYVLPFANKIVKNNACYQHLQYTGCGSIEVTEISLESVMGRTYKGLFQKGFDPKEINERGISLGADPRFFMPCLNDGSKIQVNAISDTALKNFFDEFGITPDDQAKILKLFKLNMMNNKEIKAKCIELRPYMADVFDIWSNSAMKHFQLTSVGIAIGHANIKRLTGEFADLSIWIN